MILSIVSALLICIVPISLSYYLMNKKSVYEFKRLAEMTGLNFALPKRKHLFEASMPALAGEYKDRSVNMLTKKNDETNRKMTELAMNCNTGSLTATVRIKEEDESDYIYQTYRRSRFKPMLTGYAQFDKNFVIVVEDKDSINLFTKAVREFLLERRPNITSLIEIRGYEIVVDDSEIALWEKTEGGIAENAVYMLNFLSELADLLEQKRLS
jgi:hypothetical protein